VSPTITAIHARNDRMMGVLVRRPFRADGKVVQRCEQSTLMHLLGAGRSGLDDEIRACHRYGAVNRASSRPPTHSILSADAEVASPAALGHPWEYWGGQRKPPATGGHDGPICAFRETVPAWPRVPVADAFTERPARPQDFTRERVHLASPPGPTQRMAHAGAGVRPRRSDRCVTIPAAFALRTF